MAVISSTAHWPACPLTHCITKLHLYGNAPGHQSSFPQFPKAGQQRYQGTKTNAYARSRCISFVRTTQGSKSEVEWFCVRLKGRE